MSDGQRYTKAVNLQGFGVLVMSATWKSGPTFMALSDRSLSLKTIIRRWGKWRNGATGHPEQTNAALPVGGPTKKLLSYPYSSPNILICPSQLFAKTVWLQFLFNPSRPTVCVATCQILHKTVNYFILISQILKQCILYFTFNNKSSCRSWAKAIFSAESNV